MRILLAISMLAIPAFGGKSLQLATETASNTSVAAQGANSPCRLELQVTLASTTGIVYPYAQACGINFQATNASVQIFSERVTGYSCCHMIQVSSFTGGWMIIRFQMVPSGAGGTLLEEAWDINGVLQDSYSGAYTGTSGSNSNGAQVTGGSGGTTSYGFYRLFTTTLPLGSAEPNFAQTGDLLDIRFDNGNNTGSLTDNSGHGYDFSGVSPSNCGSSPCYAATTGQDRVFPRIYTTLKANWPAFMQEHPSYGCPWDSHGSGVLDSTDSFSMADADASVTPAWSISTGPTITNPSSTTTSVTGLSSFGSYAVTLIATAADMVSTGTASVQVGSLPMDANGVVTQSDPNVAAIFGPMIALCKNPWGYYDRQNLIGMEQRGAWYQTAYPNSPGYTYGNPPWANAQTGTVAYTWNGSGVGGIGGAGTTLNGSITSTATSIVLTAAPAGIDFSALPTKIFIMSASFDYHQEEIDICSWNAGTLTATVCYDGRGKGAVTGGSAYVLGPTAWASGSLVGQGRIKGTGTSFLSTLAPAGAGPIGKVSYSTGTVTVTAGSTTLTGSGTTWNTGNGVVQGYGVRVAGTTHSGTPFVFVRYIESVDSSTQITLNYPFPSDADTASGLSYSIVLTWTRAIVTQFTRPLDGSHGLTSWGGTTCISDTQCFFNAGMLGTDAPSVNGTTFTGMTYSWDEPSGYVNSTSTGGVNFYGEDLANWATFYRSGIEDARTFARQISNNWLRNPALRGGLGGTVYSPLFIGGGYIGAIASLVLDSGSTALSWGDARAFANSYASTVPTFSCNLADTRDYAYLRTLIAMPAIYDPDLTFRATWRTALKSTYDNHDTTCQRAGDSGVRKNSYANQLYFNNDPARAQVAAVTVSNTTAVTAAGTINSGQCDGVDAGMTLTMTNGSAAVVATSGTFTAGVNTLTVNGRTFYFIRTDGTHGTIGATWPDATSSYTGMSRLVDYSFFTTASSTFGTDNDDPDLQYNYACKFNSSSSITLDRNFQGTVGSKFLYTFNIAGLAQQSFMMGINALTMNYAAPLDATISANYTQKSRDTAAWIHDYGYDTATKGVYYARVAQWSESGGTTTGTNDWVIPVFRLGASDSGMRTARAENAEITASFTLYAAANNYSAPSIAYGDEAYNAVWGNCIYATGVALSQCASVYVQDENGLTSLAGGKWYGFFFGIGMGHQWPAARLGAAPVTGNPRINGKSKIGGKVKQN